jgi:hypothetical protein
MVKGTKKPARLHKGANNSQTRDYLFQLFQQGHPPDLALDSLKRAREIGEATRAFSARPGRAAAPSNGACGGQDED